ncbi:MAG: hypothetical protein ACYDGY_08925 [Acidimicrobiales bacterium]
MKSKARTAAASAGMALSITAGIVLGISLNRPLSSRDSGSHLRPVAPVSYANEPGNSGASDSLLNTIVAAEAVYSRNDTYSAVTPSLLSSLSAHVDIIGPVRQSTNPAEVSLLAGPQHITMSVRSSTGLCVFALAIKAQASAASYNHFKVPGKGTYYAHATGVICAADAAPSRDWSTTAP